LVSGSLLGHESPRVVQIDSFYLDGRPEGIILIMGNLDVPGVVGRVGTLLGQHAINIAEWRLGRTTPGDRALSFVNLDASVPREVLTDLGRLEGVTSARQVTL
jgi:D-3-phosphoglycerate dehydrogenase